MSKTIFLVDDDASVRTVLERLVRRLRPDDAVIAFSSPRDLLLAALDGRWPHLVLTDRDMPEYAGEELASRLAYAGYRGWVVMITGGELVVPPAHVDEIIRKPFTREEIEEMLTRRLDPS